MPLACIHKNHTRDGNYSLCVQEEPHVNAPGCPLHSCWAALLHRFVAAGDAHSVLRALDAASAATESAGDPLKDNRVWLLTPSKTEDLMDISHQTGLHGEQMFAAASDVADLVQDAVALYALQDLVLCNDCHSMIV